VIPPALVTKAQDHDIPLSLQQWQNLTPLQRFALIKLSRPSHESKNFLPALQEFELI
ncbi:MAG: nitrate reductase associated protein, partial [Acaryochloridaceae cyanobacterium CSU_3_4]|nr:nitrate reductase associated protein [Acaryochloridaceae cyanobacterium CSU_3_4]